MKRILTAAIGAALVLPASAAAEGTTSSCQAYNPQLCLVQHHNRTPTTGSGTLPFTGLDVALLAVGGGGLLGTGLVVRRLSSHTE